MILLFQERGGDASLDILKILATFRRDSAIVNSPVGIRKHYHSNIAASIKAIAKNVNLLDAWDYEEKNWQVNSCFAASI